MKQQPDDSENRDVDPVQTDVALIISWIVRIGIVLMLGTFVLYVTGIIPSATEPQNVASAWDLGASVAGQAVGSESAWAWIAALSDSVSISFAAIVLFPLATIVVVIVAGLLYARRRMVVYAVMLLFQAIVLIVAASGITNAGL
jgi:hypothetical protein